MNSDTDASAGEREGTEGSGTPLQEGNRNDQPDPDEHRVFWADTVADEIEARDPDEPIVIKGGVSPSGIPHLGHFNEILRGYFVAEILRERGYQVRQVFTSDDRDALRKVPRRLADTDWTIVELGDVDAEVLGRNLGVPYTHIPDPFGDCHDSYGDHFTGLLRKSADLVGVPVEFISNTTLYTDGTFEEPTEIVLADLDNARDVLSEYQDGVDASYVPFMPQCEACGRLTTGITSVNLAERTVEYECVGLTAGKQEIDGCGHAGTATFRQGKLPWRFEWPAQWRVLGVDFEPFGKDHAEGSWPSGKEIAQSVFDEQPPIPMTYEWFTVNGEPLSSSEGNVITVREVLDLIEPEVLRYFFVRDPKKARDFDVERIDQLVNEFDRLERVYFDEEEASEQVEAFAERVYPFLVDEVRAGRVRLPYSFAAVLGMVDDRDFRIKLARDEGHLAPDTPDWAVDDALDRVERARRWAQRCDNAYNYRLQTTLPDHEFDSKIETALDELAAFVAEEPDGEAIQAEIYETAKRHDIDISEFFSAGYRLFFDETQGPRLGEFLGELEREFVVRRLRREG